MITKFVAYATEISIHAPLAGRDPMDGGNGPSGRDFNPRAPRGARLSLPMDWSRDAEFQSTRPSRGATGQRLVSASVDCISIHAPLAGRDIKVINHRITDLISIHAPLAGRDAFCYYI